jgi:hypothetical protein
MHIDGYVADPAGYYISSAGDLESWQGPSSGPQLTSGDLLLVRDYAMPINIRQASSLGAGSLLRLEFEDATWGSTIQVLTGLGLSLGRTLDLTLAENADSLSLVGTTFHVFQWSHREHWGYFDSITTSPGLDWDTSKLYSHGTVTLVSVPEPDAIVMLGAGLALLAAIRFSRIAATHSSRTESFQTSTGQSQGRRYRCVVSRTLPDPRRTSLSQFLSPVELLGDGIRNRQLLVSRRCICAESLQRAEWIVSYRVFDGYSAL